MIDCIKKRPDLRDSKDIYIIYKYLQRTSLADILSTEKNRKSSMHNMMIYVSMNMEYLNKKKGDILFREGIEFIT